ncbi:RagB/SusD family nutrient uptake outer membrane protein [Pontibacter cellulosilyticus]|uniref:RagB/SusD family nutrient uptake outer membrane protein n=1 Tax=Pontibacter cellulosilyticus TaxID=1720253 RepID=A0A923N7I4_9BACT|nr:RagB/SusD family nutrient uptake outer membrane protein [Pontibacter cellulosilyticus]MBC5992851.1 RagB/SusD family nutrient uptake outer membrane protein [Pontibacter cellulosilyticus]
MKKSLNIIAAAILAFTISSCEKEFLDVEPTNNLSLEQIEEAAKTDPSLLNSFVSGMYATMYNTGTGGTTGHDDFGQRGYDIYMDMVSSDMVLAGTTYGWYSGIARYQATTDNTVNQSYMPWRYYYRMIRSANTLIDILGGNEAPQTGERLHMMGQAKAMRAYAYFYLAQLYSEGYKTGEDKILPIYTTTKDAAAQPKSTTKEVYDLIISDLEAAITGLQGFNRVGKHEVNQNVAKGLLAYVLAARGTQADLQRVVTLTNEVITTSGARITNPNEVVAKFDADGKLVNTEAGFNSVTTPSWIWGVDLVLDYGLNLVSWWGQVDVFTYSYAWAGDPKTIDRGLYDAIPANDIRKQQFIAPGKTGALQPRNKFFAPARKIGGQRYIETDYVYMRIEDMVLLNAEANARLGQAGPARDMLKTLLAKRFDDAADYSYVDALSGQALLDEIHLQTRIELWGEGKSYLSVKRNKRTVTRGANHLFEAGNSFAWDSDELTFNIPQAEVLNNPVLND